MRGEPAQAQAVIYRKYTRVLRLRDWRAHCRRRSNVPICYFLSNITVKAEICYIRRGLNIDSNKMKSMVDQKGCIKDCKRNFEATGR